MNKLAILVACPSKADGATGYPLSGNQGTIIQDILGKSGVGWDDVKVFCMLDKAAPRNDALGMEMWFEQHKGEVNLTALSERLVAYAPTMVLCLGAAPLKLLNGKEPISDYRGSLFMSSWDELECDCTSNNCSQCEGTGWLSFKCIATYHPTWLTRDWSLQPYTKVDVRRCAKELAAGPGLVLPKREVIIENTFQGALDSIASVYSAGLAGQPVSVDSEGGISSLTMLGFALGTHVAVVIPFIDDDGNSIWTEDEEVAIWEAAKPLLEDPDVPKVMQNYQSDAFILAWSYGIVLRGLRHDVMLMAWEAQPELEKGLASVASLYTREPFWKSTENYRTRLAWVCGMDCMLTLECCQVLDKLLKPGQREHYELNLRHLPIVLYEMLEGLPFDRKQARADLDVLEKQIYETQHEIDHAAGRALPQDGNALLALATDAFAQARRVEKVDQVEQRWQPMKWNGKKWVKGGKMVGSRPIPYTFIEQDTEPAQSSDPWLKPAPRTVKVSQQAVIASWSDLGRWVKFSCKGAYERVRDLSGELDAIQEESEEIGEIGDTKRYRTLLGELSILLGLAVKSSSTNQGGDCQWLLHEAWGLPKKFKKTVHDEDEATATDPKVTTDKSALLSLYARTQQPEWAEWRRHSKLRGEELKAWLAESGRRLLLVLKMRSLEKERAYLDVETDSDGQLRYGLNLVQAATGRFAAYGSPTGKSKLNPQTVGKKHRHLYHV